MGVRKNREDCMRQIKGCIICETPYNIFNAMKLIYSEEGKTESKIDLFLSQNLCYLRDNIIITGLFNNIWIFNNGGNVKLSFGERVDRFFRLGKCIRDDVDGMLEFEEYEEIYIFSATRFPINMIYKNRKAKVVYVEDGMDSYIGRIKPAVSRKARMICALVGRNYKRIIPDIVYLNEPQICDASIDYHIKRIPNQNFRNTKLNVLYRYVFNYQEEPTYKEKRIIYLGQAFVADRMGMGIEKIEDSIAEKMQFFEDKVIYRKHPREDEVSLKWQYIDEGTNMWELVCQDDIDDDSILLSSFSTALFIPKILYDKEPWLIYTYKLYDEYFAEENNLIVGIEKMITRIRASYSNCRKVICVKNVGEIPDIISEIINN